MKTLCWLIINNMYLKCYLYHVVAQKTMSTCEGKEENWSVLRICSHTQQYTYAYTFFYPHLSHLCNYSSWVQQSLENLRPILRPDSGISVALPNFSWRLFLCSFDEEGIEIEQAAKFQGPVFWVKSDIIQASVKENYDDC